MATLFNLRIRGRPTAVLRNKIRLFQRRLDLLVEESDLRTNLANQLHLRRARSGRNLNRQIDSIHEVLRQNINRQVGLKMFQFNKKFKY